MSYGILLKLAEVWIWWKCKGNSIALEAIKQFNKNFFLILSQRIWQYGYFLSFKDILAENDKTKLKMLGPHVWYRLHLY